MLMVGLKPNISARLQALDYMANGISTLFCVYHKVFFVKPYLSILNNIFNFKLKEDQIATDVEWWHIAAP